MKLRSYAKSAAYYDLIYESIVDYEEECNLLEDLFRQCAARKVKRVLDLGCGTGNHAIILSSRGYDVLGMDLSEDFIRLAQEKVTLSEGGPRFVVGDMGKLDLKERSDAIISMFGAFGYIPRLGAPGVLKGFAEKLTEGGLLIFEFWNRLAIQPGHRSWLEREADELRLVRLSRSVFDPKSGVVHPIMKHYV
ncbi:MAG: class I SAM-dependent methyltransferase, partial [Candidatus Thermoplasmatota archaeon]|nr:class I SAM-dependent methyltransferase [Candidatus Thermoplasmatota archaeon]